MSTDVLQADLPALGGVATIQISGALSTLEWHAVLRVAAPQVYEPPSVRTTQGDVVRFDFPLSHAFHGKPYELDVYAEGDQRMTIARGTVVNTAGVLDVPVSFADLEVPDTQVVHVQDAASEQWIVEHDLGGYPPVTIVDSSLREVVGDVTYLDTRTIQIDFSAAFGGRAFIRG